MKQVAGTDICIFSTKEIVELVQKNVLLADSQNRGQKGTNQERIVKIANALNYKAFGMISFTPLKNSKFQTIDGHHRIEALVMASKLGKLNENAVIPVRIVPASEATEIYTLGAEAKGHTAQDKFNTLRYAQAKDISNFAEINGLTIPRNKRVVVGSLFYALMKTEGKKTQLTYPEVYGVYRKQATNMATRVEPKPFYNLNKKTLQNLVEAFSSYNELMKEVKQLTNTKNQKVLFNKLQRPGFLGLFLTDYISSAHGITTSFKSNEKLAQILLNDIGHYISAGLAELTGNSEEGVMLIRKGLGLKK